MGSRGQTSRFDERKRSPPANSERVFLSQDVTYQGLQEKNKQMHRKAPLLPDGSREQGPVRQDIPNAPTLEGAQGWSVDSGRRERWGLDGDAAASKRGFQVLSPPCCIAGSCNTSTPQFSALIPLQAAKINTLPALDLHSASNTRRQLHLSATLYVTVTKRKPVGACPQRLQRRLGSGAALALSWFGLSLCP